MTTALQWRGVKRWVRFDRSRELEQKRETDLLSSRGE
jgi:hypothetical protein